MTKQSSRRDILKGGLTLAGLVLGMPEWVLPALAQGETLVPFTDLPDTINLRRTPERRIIDIRTIDGPFTPTDEFFTVQHYGHPVIDPATYRLRVSGVVDPATSLSIDELRKMPSRELVFGFECSGNRGPVNGLASNGRWTGVPLRAVLDLAGVRPEAREAVFFGADHGEEDVEFRGRTYKVDQQFGRSLPREKALSPEPLLAYALNGEPPATMDPATRSTYSWKFFTYDWLGATAGEHTLLSRVTDVNGNVQPTPEELETKKTFLEHNAQHPRTVMIG